MKKLVYLLSFLLISFSLFSCKSIEVVSISQQQTKVSEIRDYILIQSIYNLDSNSFNNLSLKEIMGDAFEYLDLQKNEIPYLNANLNQFTQAVHLSYVNSLFEIQKVLYNYSKKLNYPLIYPNVNNKYIITERSSSILLNTYRDEIYLEIDNILNKNLNSSAILYTTMAKEYNIYCLGLENLNRQSPKTISTNIMPRLKTVFIKTLMNELSENENALDLLNTPIDPTTITID